MNRYLKLSLCIIIPLAIGGISGFATVASVNTWYVTLHKPSFNPPNYLFGPVWTTLYLLMGISLYMILQMPATKIKHSAITLFCIQLLLNFCWSFLFFKFQLLGIAFIEIIVMWVSILTMIILFFEINRKAALLQVPYLLWVSFASVLNGSIWFLN
ncbi:MAG: tryptophan-rich sensory protein [Bacteroidetes bacterium]|nr:tryptophan-rich sensory protein [Bacteroidota bacterium]